jgi:peptidoglycan/xylan/chitin deacetylase (PgdA/CDA1 family)
MRKLFKYLLIGSDRLKLLDLGVRLKHSNLVIVVYHNIGFPNDLTQTFEEPLPPTFIEKQINFLLRSGFIITSLSEALKLVQRDTGSKKIAVITFDDGYKGIYTYAFPILKRYKIKATIYLTAGFIKNRVAPWWEQLYYIFRKTVQLGKLSDLAKLLEQETKGLLREELQEMNTSLNSLKSLIEVIIRSTDVIELRNFIHKLSKGLGIKIPNKLYDELMLSIDEIKEMVEYGVEIGGHGLWHTNLTKISKDRLLEEVKESLNFIKTLYEGPYTFAYPFGIYNDEVVNIVKSTGYKAAVTLTPKTNSLPLTNPYKLGRIPPYRFGLKDIASFKYSICMS